MSQSSSTPPRQRRGGRNRNRPADHGSRDQHERQRHHRDTETFQRPKGGPKLTLWQKVLSLIGLGPKPPLRRADRPATSEPTNDAPRPARPPQSQSRDRSREPREAREPREPREPRESREPREIREPRETREARPPREPKPPRPVMQHEVTTGRLYVGNLSYDVTETDLTELFGGIGQVRHAEVVVNRATQRSKGFAFVEMLTIDEAKRAVAELHDKEYMGRKMLVTGAKAEDQPKPAETEERPVRLQEEPTLREDRPYRREERSSEPREERPAPREERSREPREERPRRESRPASPIMGDITTGIIRREQIEAAHPKPPTP